MDLARAVGGRVSTHLGLGWLWQAFAGRLGVVLDDLPTRVVFLEAEAAVDVHPLPGDGSVPPWRRPKPKRATGRGRETFFGLGED